MAHKSLLTADFGARVRAARGYAAMSRKELAAALDIADAGEGTIKGWELDPSKRPRPLAEGEVVRRLAEVSRLPEAFFTADLAVLFENLPESVDSRLSTIEDKLDSLTERRDVIAEEIAGADIEDLTYYLKAGIRGYDRLTKRMAPDLGKDDLDWREALSRSEEDLPPEAPEAAA